jgi:uncharacterized phosphosugar-binding protein
MRSTPGCTTQLDTHSFAAIGRFRLRAGGLHPVPPRLPEHLLLRAGSYHPIIGITQ